MTDTRKQIIELIEPYMEKDLVDWCIVIAKNYIWYKKISHTIWWLVYLYWIELPFRHSFADDYKDSLLKILGHYDITAVLKYIDFRDKIAIVYNDNYIKFITIRPNIITWYSLKYYIPNKPLHLYTEQEEKDLLELLLKLTK